MQRKLLLIIFLFCCAAGIAQKRDQIESLIEDGEYYLEDRQYEKAYACFNKLISLDTKNELYYKLKKGVAASHIPSKKEEAITLLEEVKNVDTTHHAIFFHLGEAYHHNYKFDQAIVYLKKFLRDAPDAKERKEAEMSLLQAENGKKVTQTIFEADIRNIGAPVNTEDAEYVPVISADESVLIYTYRGKQSTGGLMDVDFKKDPDGEYYEDIFITRKAGENWETPQSIGSNINTKHNDASIALSPDGQELYTFYSTKKDGGDIYVCRLVGDKWSDPVKLGPNINTKYWEGSCSVSADGRFFYFASERPGGLGGKDIYVSEKQPDNSWGPAVNMGPAINTVYDDDSPFIHPDGLTLFFSSKGHNSIGGYDIMFSIKKDNVWLSPETMGYPLNTTDDDIYYVLNAKGDKGYFSSTRTQSGAMGSHDIYTVTPGTIGEKPVLAMLKGVVYGNGVPIEAEFIIEKQKTKERIGPFHSNKKSGRYLVALTHGESYNIRVEAKTYPVYYDTLDIERITKFLEIKKDFYLSKGGYQYAHDSTIKLVKLTNILDTITDISFLMDSILPTSKDTMRTAITTPKDTIPQVVKTTTDTVPQVVSVDPCAEFKTLNFAELKRKSLNNPAVYKKLLEIGTKICAKGMVFKVQVAAYKFPQNYKWDHLREFGEPETQKLDDGITRFTQGQFVSIHDAEAQRQKAINKGQTDAWITGFIDGKRYTLEELIMVDFFNKNIANYEKLYKELEELLAAAK